MFALRDRLLVLLLSFAFIAADARAAEPVSLFDGQTLAGWEGDEKTFRVEDGAIVAGSLEHKIPQNEFLCTTEEYGDFELRLKAKLIGQGRNAGVQFRTERVPNHHEVVGYQCDIGQMGETLIWGALYDESRRKKFLVPGNTKKLAGHLNLNGWNALRIRCEGPRIQIWVNGIPTTDYTEPDPTIPRHGRLALQIHSGPPAEARYKEIVLERLE